MSSRSLVQCCQETFGKMNWSCCCYYLGPFLPCCADASLSPVHSCHVRGSYAMTTFYVLCTGTTTHTVAKHTLSDYAVQEKRAWAQNSLLVLVHPLTTQQLPVPFVCTPRRYDPNVNILPPTQLTADGGRFCWKRKDANLFRDMFSLFPFGWES